MKNSLFYVFFILFILVLARIVPHPPNFTPILAMSIMGPLIFKNRLLGMLIPVLALFLSDIILGFHIYQLVVYSSILIISLVAPMYVQYKKIIITAFGSCVWFFITTNFAVWLMWDYYPKSFQGLITCYILAIPFFTNTLISTFIFTGIILFSLKYLRALNLKTNLLLNTFLQKI